MSRPAKILLEKEILLESGTNELEILVFRLGEYTFGINVAKVREVLPRGPITSLAAAHPSVLGVFRLREAVVPVVSLRRHLETGDGEPGSDQTLILADFNQQQTAFVVDAVERIHRLSWEQILAVPAISSLAHSPVTAVARIGERLVIMLDFEMITDQVTRQAQRTGAVANPQQLARGELRILLADDSPTVREAVTRTLRASGYTRVKTFASGRDAWQWLESEAAATGDTARVAGLLISDVEMPQIDGLHLCKRIKEHPVLRTLPVLLYSSIVTPDNQKKGQAVGADAQISKPELAKVVEWADSLIGSALERRQPDTLHNWLKTPASAAEPDEMAAERSPDWEVEIDEPPAEANPRLWLTFRAELGDRARHLLKLLAQLRRRAGEEGLRLEVLRTLHTIKSAAMVVPVHEATRLTHLMEGTIAEQADPARWPLESLELYADWLLELSSPGAPVAAVLARGRELTERVRA